MTDTNSFIPSGDATCCICHGDCVKNPTVIFVCNHFVCMDCWIDMRLITQTTKCPLCRCDHGSLRTTNFVLERCKAIMAEKIKTREVFIVDSLDELEVSLHDKKNIDRYLTNKWNQLVELWNENERKIIEGDCHLHEKINYRDFLKGNIGDLEIRLNRNDESLLFINEKMESLRNDKDRIKQFNDNFEYLFI